VSVRFFLDTEFYEDGQTIELISIGLVADNGAEFYRVVEEFNWGRFDDEHWLVQNVKPHLVGSPRSGRSEIARDLAAFVAAHSPEDDRLPRPEFWAYFGAYDWVATIQLYGTFFSTPGMWPHLFHDVGTLRKLLPDRLRPARTEPLPSERPEHHALADARRCRRLYHEHVAALRSLLRGDEP
jgi:hypothetical protein